MNRLEVVALAGVGRVREGDDLAQVALAAARAMGLPPANGDILAFAQKVVSKAEGRFAVLEEIEPSPRAVELARQCLKEPEHVELVLRESRAVVRVAPNVLIVEDRRGLVLANAGIDRSNVERDARGRERALLLPEDPDASAARLRERVCELAGVDLGVLINDSLGRAWRQGTVGTAIGAAGLPGLLDLRGRPDREGRPLLITEVGMADELAAAASAVMGQSDEGTPIVLVRGVPWPRREGNARELQRPKDKDLFR